ncbi:hypothetical protein [Neisseria polysaccharea]|uniref:hypothetical protein n=1 Tax=Neisseria polysaccharea TaxID=489 RepID=UPI002729B4E5|nr:hypothetical protein [Neisseria polysaccharea]
MAHPVPIEHPGSLRFERATAKACSIGQCCRVGFSPPLRRHQMPCRASDGIAPAAVIPMLGQRQFLKIIKTRHSRAGGNLNFRETAIFKDYLKV